METKDGVILDTNGKYCEDYVQVTPTNADAISAQNIKELKYMKEDTNHLTIRILNQNLQF